MDPRFLPHNSHRDAPRGFRRRDPQLRHLAMCPVRHRSALLDRLPVSVPGIYSLGGGRQAGKSTLLKQWIAELLDGGVPPDAITYLTGELIDDQHGLLMHVNTHLDDAPGGALNYLVVDEVTYIRDWDKTIKFAADAGLLEETVLVVTGSEPGRHGGSQNAVSRPPRHGLRGGFPLASALVRRIRGAHGPSPRMWIRMASQPRCQIAWSTKSMRRSTATCSTAATSLRSTTLRTMARSGQARWPRNSDWIRGDVLKRGRQETYLREVLAAVVKRYASQVTWNALAQDLSIDHPKTVADYIALLERMDAVCVLPALIEDKLAPAPKKARKLMFCDPFILHAVRAWLQPRIDPFGEPDSPGCARPGVVVADRRGVRGRALPQGLPDVLHQGPGGSGCRLRAGRPVLAGGGEVDEPASPQDAEADRPATATARSGARAGSRVR